MSHSTFRPQRLADLVFFANYSESVHSPLVRVPVLRWGLAAGVLLDLFALGVLWALVLASWRPGIYRGITGTHPTETTAAPAATVEAL